MSSTVHGRKREVFSFLDDHWISAINIHLMREKTILKNMKINGIIEGFQLDRGVAKIIIP